MKKYVALRGYVYVAQPSFSDEWEAVYLASDVDAEERKHVARIAELEKAMVDLVTSHNGYNKGLGPCICAAHEEARRVLGMTRDDAHPARSL